VNQNARPNSAVAISEEPSTFQVRVKDLSTGKEASISDAERFQFHPQISRDGTLLVYSAVRAIQIFRIDPWPPRTMFAIQKDHKAWDWSTDNKRLLIGTYPAANIYVYDVSSRRESLFLSKPGYELFQAKFSPDNRAVALIGCDSQRPGRDCRLFVVPLKTDGAPEADNWIAIDHPSRWDDKPRWSPDGNLIYFVSDRDGQFCLWAQRLDTRTKRPVGTPFPAYHFHDSRLAMNNVGTSELEIDVARNRIVIGLGELTGNIWSLKR
jgi:eukaryotic-like serine/threonine-protein kinase